MKTKAAGFPETSVNFRQTTPRHITGNGIRETQSQEPQTSQEMRTVIARDYFQNEKQKV